MKCFYHPTVDAVGSCKHCCRGLCVECAAERDGGLACRNRHEATVDAVSTLVERNVRITKRAWQSVLLACIVFCGAGGVFIYLLFRELNATMRIMFGVMAALMFVIAIPQTRYLITVMRKGKQRAA